MNLSQYKLVHGKSAFRELSEASGVSTSTLYAAINGGSAAPSFPTAEKLADNDPKGDLNANAIYRESRKNYVWWKNRQSAV